VNAIKPDLFIFINRKRLPNTCIKQHFSHNHKKLQFIGEPLEREKILLNQNRKTIAYCTET